MSSFKRIWRLCLLATITISISEVLSSLPRPSGALAAEVTATAEARAAIAAGRAAMAGQNYDKAEAAFRRATAIDPVNTDALEGLAQSLEKQRKFDEAAKVYEQQADLLVKAAGNSPPPAPPAPAAAGEKLEGLDTAKTWYPITVLKTDGDKRFVHYVGWGNNWDEWLGPDRIRKATGAKPGPFAEKATAQNAAPEKTTPDKTPAAVAPGAGDALEGLDTAGTWYPVRVLKTDGNKRFIHYVGWSDQWNEWLGPDRAQGHRGQTRSADL